MVQSENPGQDTSSRSAENGLSKWFSPRRKRFWGIVAILSYTLAGFFAVPALVKSVTVNAIQSKAGRTATIERVRFNPYVLSLEINGFAVIDPDDVKLASFERFFANFQLSSLINRAWTFDLVALDGFNSNFERFAPGDNRVTRLLADVAERRKPAEPQDHGGGLPRLLIHNLDLNEGRLHFSDNVPGDPVEMDFGPITVSMQALNTLPDRSGQQSVTIHLPDNARLSWQGSIELEPLYSEGTLVVENSRLDQAISYLKAQLPLSSIQATLSVRTNYRISEKSDGSPEIELDDLEADLADVAISGLTPSSELFAFPSLTLSGGGLRYPENELQFSSVRLAEPDLETWRDVNGKLNLLELVPNNGNDTGEVTDAAKWHFAIDKFVIENGRIGFADHGVEPQVTEVLEDLDLSLTNFSNDAGAEFPVSLEGKLAEGGDFGFEGQLSMPPDFALSGAVRASAIPVSTGQPYLQQKARVLINRGTLDTTFDLTLRPDRTLTAAGELSIAGFSMDDTDQNLPLVGWERLDIDRFEADTASRTLNLSLLSLDQISGRVVINPDRTTNLSGLRVINEARTEPAAVASAVPPKFAVIVGHTAIQDGSLDFADLSLPLPFATHIKNLGGTISTLDTTSTAASAIKLEGQVDDYGLARIQGEMNLLNPVNKTDVSVEFRNLLMSNLSPYTVQFAGHRIDEGKLDLDLVYKVDEGQLSGQNQVVLNNLQLGEKIESPDAADLPLGLAIALLKNADGVIDIDLPVEGNVNDPEFKIGGVIWQAFSGLITKIVSAPFRLLGSLIGIDSEDLGQFQFLAGRADLTPPELEKVIQLQQALQQRPELAVEISGVFNSEIDVPALQYKQLRDAVISRLGTDPAGDGDDIQMLDEQIRSTLEAIFVERFPDIPLDSLKATHSAAPAADPNGKPVLDGPAYAVDLRDRMLAAEVINSSELEELANSRAEVVRSAFLESGEFDDGRITIATPVEVESSDSEWVVMELGVTVE